MVGMVMGDENATQERSMHIVLTEIAFQLTNAHAGINQHSIFPIREIGAISATSTAKTYEL